MSVILINDEITPHLEKILSLSGGFINQALSKTAADIQKAAIAKTRSSESHSWGQKFDTDARRKITFGRASKKRYSRFSRKSGTELHGMESFIKFRIYPESHKAVVGFINTSSFMSYSFNGGIQKNFKMVKKQTPKDLAEKLSQGGKEILTPKQRAFFRASGMYGIAKKGYVVKKANPIMNPVIASMSGSLRRRFEEAFSDEYKSANIKVKPIRRRA